MICAPGVRQDDVMKMPLYPTEELIWDPNLVPEEHYSGKVSASSLCLRHGFSAISAGDYSLALPKLNLQFLTIHATGFEPG